MPRIKLITGDLRELTRAEKELYPDFKYVVIAECICIINDKKVCIPTGFLTDGSSGGPDWGWSWLIHDYLYEAQQYEDGTLCTREEADNIMYNLLKYERQYIYAALFKVATKLCRCQFEKAWERNKKQGVTILE